ncbi:dna invertase [Leptolyngbya sp. Heron Island J]|uniref:recombinase family protein n=1 Tax=Leptolyngbya sp. Heron Island J TaxID=1385935 RepID=UPI0003B992EF|nr:recombinase family protein [Leptolyngbya sp. Heron Island J]ESA37113.1 dna invertase [Leptolyngbya sp. Heron Island J]
MLIGYERVSTPEQSLEPQHDKLREAGCEQIFSDIVSGAKAARPGLDEALSYIREGDVLVVVKLDRLGRTLKHLIETVEGLNTRGIGFKSLADGIDTTTSAGKLMFHIIGAIAEFERDLIRERTQAGLKAARARGRLGGRPTKVTPQMIRQIEAMLHDDTITVGEACTTVGISKASYYKHRQNVEGL